MLLATITIPGNFFDAGIQAPAHMSFGVEAREPFPGMSFGFINQYTPDQVGSVYEAPSTLVAQMAPIFADPSGEIFGVGSLKQWITLRGRCPVGRFLATPNKRCGCMVRSFLNRRRCR
jgi:hypothetical protein